VTRIFTSDTDAPGMEEEEGEGEWEGGRERELGLMQRVCPHTRERAAVVPSAIGASPRGGNELHLLAETREDDDDDGDDDAAFTCV